MPWQMLQGKEGMLLFFALNLFVLPLAAVLIIRRILGRKKTARPMIAGAWLGLILGVSASTLQDWGQAIVTRLNPDIAEPKVNLVVSLVAGSLVGIALGATLTTLGNRTLSYLRRHQ